jgi:hypothetical protein
MRREAVVFLCTNLQNEVVKFANQIYKQTDFEVFLIVDSNDKVELKDNLFTIIQYEDSICKDAGYLGCNNKDKTHIQKEVIAWDKFFYAFCNELSDYNFVWVFEEDVFIPSIECIVNINRKYGHYDLVTANNFKKTDNVPDWHWIEIFKKLEPPYYFSMVSACGLSKNLFQEIKKYVEKNKYLVHHEVLLNTLANQSNLKVITAKELKSIVWLGEWGIDEFIRLPDNFFHPRKDIENYSYIRETIAEHILAGYKPKKKLPDFLR